MVDRADLPKINMLYTERGRINMALKMFDEGGRIVAMTVNKPRAEGQDIMSGPSVTVGTSEMEYPAQMTEAIKNFLHVREEQIREELTAMGVTGIGEPELRKGERK